MNECIFSLWIQSRLKFSNAFTRYQLSILAAATFISGAMSGANSTATLSWKADTVHIICCLVLDSLDLLTTDFLCLVIYSHCLLIYFFLGGFNK
uniref:Uncharacterized protein n=2 Tax=Picea TaxID=3328 RepID=A0A124GP52_PICGL|nr:hypothetical protein ABT39_MTgene702 [Picea glauca]QHR90220.1 hypothetical protein Q903MT_gene4243 [Picea sitchensis]